VTCPGLSYDNALVLSQQDKNHSLPILRRRESRDIRVGPQPHGVPVRWLRRKGQSP